MNYYKRYDEIYKEIISKDPSLINMVEIIKNVEIDNLSLLIDGYHENKEILIFYYMKPILRLALEYSNNYSLDIADCISEGYVFLLTNIDIFVSKHKSYYISTKINDSFRKYMDRKVKQNQQYQKQISIYESDVCVDWVDNFDEMVDLNNLNIILNQLLSSIPERESSIIKLRHGFEDDECYSFAKIGEIYNISNSRVSQIYAKGLRRLRHPSGAKQIRSYYNDYVRCAEFKSKDIAKEDIIHSTSLQNNKQKYPQTMEEKKKKEIMDIYNSFAPNIKEFINSTGFNDFLNSNDINFLIRVEFYIKDRFKFLNNYETLSKEKLLYNSLERLKLSFNSTINIYYLLRVCLRLDVNLDNICLLLTPEILFRIKSSKIIQNSVLEELSIPIFRLNQLSFFGMPDLLRLNFGLANRFYKMIYGVFDDLFAQNNKLKTLFYLSYIDIFNSINYYSSPKYSLFSIAYSYRYKNFNYEEFLDIVDEYGKLNILDNVSRYKRLNQLRLPSNIWTILKINDIKNYDDLFKYFDLNKLYFDIEGFTKLDSDILTHCLHEAYIL